MLDPPLPQACQYVVSDQVGHGASSPGGQDPAIGIPRLVALTPARGARAAGALCGRDYPARVDAHVPPPNPWPRAVPAVVDVCARDRRLGGA
ncbi:hypothetical protein GCM10026982_46520 [Nocardiopsis aegyptia]